MWSLGPGMMACGSILVHQPGSCRYPLFGFLWRLHLHRHDWLTQWSQVIELNLPPLSCPWSCRVGTEISSPPFRKLTPLATSPHSYELYKSHLINITKVKVKVAQSCLTVRGPTDYTVHGILQARILEWVAFSLSRGSSQPRDWTHVSCIAGVFFTNWVMRKYNKRHFKVLLLRKFLGSVEL